MRVLQSSIRSVSGDVSGYRSAWAELRDQAAALGIRAWMFRAADDTSRYIEFLEWKQPDNLATPQLNAALIAPVRSLDLFGTATTQQWLET